MVENIVNFLVSSSLINVALLNKTLWPDSNAYTFTEALFSSGVWKICYSQPISGCILETKTIDWEEYLKNELFCAM